MSKHTKGPWIALPEECDKPYIRIRGTILGGRYKVANVITPFYDGIHHREAEETRANARLIAAAPDLLNALETMVDFAGPIEMKSYYCPIQQAKIKARAAIAKARGDA